MRNCSSKTVTTFEATVWVGLKNRATGVTLKPEFAIDEVQKYVNRVGLCVSVCETLFVYTSGREMGLRIGLINYPRFPSTTEQIKSHAIAIAKILLSKCRQLRVSVVMSNETIMFARKTK